MGSQGGVESLLPRTRTPGESPAGRGAVLVVVGGRLATGANPKATLNPNIPDDHKIILKQSYRVPRAVHAVAENTIRQVTIRQEKVYLRRPEDSHVDHLAAGGLSATDETSKPGEVIVSNSDWHEAQLKEQRLPLRRDLSDASHFESAAR